MNKFKAFIYKLLLIKDGETSPLLHFWFIFMFTLGIGLTIGRSSSDALFLTRYGVEYLPIIYIALAPLLAIVSIVYATQVDNVSSEKFFKYILIGLIISIFISWILMSQTESTLIYPVYYLIHKISSELLLVHGNLYLAHNFNTLQAKRLFPLIFTGEQLGCIIGGFLVSVSTSYINTDDLPLVWIALMFFGIIQLQYWHTRNGTSPYFQTHKSSGSKLKVAIQSVYQGFSFTRQSALLRSASFALFFLVIIYYILSYSTNRIFVNAFSDEQELTKFLGLLTAGTSIITLIIQLFITNRIINHYGVKKLNLLFPAILASATGVLLASFTLVFSVIVSVVRDSLLNAIQNPLRVIFFNALPSYMQGRAGAVSIAFVMPLALLACGAMLWAIQQLDSVAYFLVPCLLATIAFLYYSYKMNQTYTKALTSHLKDRLYLPDSNASNVNLDIDDDTLSSLKETFTKLPQSRGIAVSLLATYSPEKSFNFIIPRLNDISASDIDVYINALFKNKRYRPPYKIIMQLPIKDIHIRSTLLKLLSDNNYPEAISMALKNLDSTSPRMRTAVVYTLIKDENENKIKAIKLWNHLLDGDKYEQLSSLILISQLDEVDENTFSLLSEKIKDAVENLLKDSDLSLAGRTLKQLPYYLSSLNQEVIFEIVNKLSNETNPEHRVYAACGARLLDDEKRYLLTHRLLGDAHTKVRIEALSTLNLGQRDNNKAINEWLLEGLSSPRVQSVLLEEAIEHELIPHKTLKSFAYKKACEANNYNVAKDIINKQIDLTPNHKLLSIVMNERHVQILDLSLQALTPLCAKDQISVIRSGLISKNSQHIANACEILNNIENQPATEIIEKQLHNEAFILPYEQAKVILTNINDVLLWASSLSDTWVSHMSNIAQGKIMDENNSRNLIERITLLKQTDIFSEVPTDDLLFIAKELQEIKYFSGERVFDINEHGDRMYIIVNGKIGISISPELSSTDYLVTLEAGSSFGEMNLLDSLPRSATAHVLEDSFLLTLEKIKLLGLLESYPDLSLGILRALSGKVRENHDRNRKNSSETN